MANFFSSDNLQSLLKNNPDSLVFAHLGSRLIDEGEYQKAIEVCSRGLEKHPDYAFGHFILGTAHYHIKNYTDAKKELEKALAYDPNNPRAWEILSAVNEILNLSDDSRRSNLQSYLIDSLNKEAASNYLPSEEIPSFSQQSPEETTETDENTSDTGMNVQEGTEQKTGENLEELLEDMVEGGQEEYDFEKALDEVFRNKEDEAQVKDEQTDQAGLIKEDTIEDEEKSVQEQSDVVSAEEFTSGIESFFEEKEDETPASVSPEDDLLDTSTDTGMDELETLSESEQPEEADLIEFTTDEGESDELISEDFFTEEQEEPEASAGEKEDSIQFSQETDETSFEELKPADEETFTSDEEEGESSDQVTESEEKTADDEFLDFKAFVSDVIKDTEEEAGSEAEPEDLPELNLEEEGEEFPVTEEPAEASPVQNDTVELREEDFELEEKSPEEVVPEQFRSGMPEDETEAEAEKEKKGKSGKPPILSPTLGEIYIAQGRFEEAIEVFTQLLEKDPENPRFQRKIDDLKKIKAKKKSGSS